MQTPVKRRWNGPGGSRMPEELSAVYQIDDQPRLRLCGSPTAEDMTSPRFV